jgi:hypothetical protein
LSCTADQFDQTGNRGLFRGVKQRTLDSNVCRTGTVSYRIGKDQL